MDRYLPSSGISKEQWVLSANPTVINYNHTSSGMQSLPVAQPPAPVQPPMFSGDFDELVRIQKQMLNSQQTNQFSPSNIYEYPARKHTSFGLPKTVQVKPVADIYNPFVEDGDGEDMEISDDEKESQNSGAAKKMLKGPEKIFTETPAKVNCNEITSGAAFYQGLILYIPPFEQLAHTYRGSPALKMLYASFEFSFKMPVKIETKPRENQPNESDATVFFRGHVLAMGSGFLPHVEASVRALELLSETCYTIQAKEDYFLKCKLVDAENMKTLNLKKWEAVSEKYPKIVEVTKDSHIQKTFAVFLDNHTSSGMYEDIVCCNLTRQEVNNIKSVVEFFHLTMLPCSISTNLSKKHTPCVVSIHKYSSAKKLLEILIECGGENDKFKVHPPDTFKDFYKLHPNYWDPKLAKKPGNNIFETMTTLEDPVLQSIIMEPYDNVISELFEKHKTLPKVDKESQNPVVRKAGDDFMKDTFQIDMAQSKKVAPVERMQLLLKYMEQLQEYGSRVLTSGRADMIKIYHNAIDNLRKDLDECRKDIEKEQKSKEKAVVVKTKESSSLAKSRSPARRKKTPPRRRSKSPPRRRSKSPARRRSKSPSKKINTVKKSPSPRHRARSPIRRQERVRRSPSPRRRPRSPLRRARSKSPRRPRVSPSRRVRSPLRSPPRKRSPLSSTRDNAIFVSIFKDQFRRYVDNLRRFHIEIEDTPVEQRPVLMNRHFTLREQLAKFKKELMENPAELGEFQYEMEICRDELTEQLDLIRGNLGPAGLVPPPPPAVSVPYPLIREPVPPPIDLYGPGGYRYPPY